ncbi:MAG: stage II sporulation protein R [Bacillus sp. (in: firmicutes)]
MKKNQVACLYIVCLCFATIMSFYLPKTEGANTSAETVVIPDEAIRLRILANSDHEEDQAVKRQIRDEVNAHITNWVGELTSMEEARTVLKSHLPDIQQIAESYMKEQGLQQDVNVEFGQAEFPTKLYGQYLYPAGEYEAIVITLGEGSGANWWCVLFPPLCFLDFSNGTAVSMSPVAEAAGYTEEEEVAEESDPEKIDEKTEKQTDSQQEVQPEETVKVKEKEAGQKTETEVAEEQSDPIYVEDEEAEVVETRWFFADFFKELF